MFWSIFSLPNAIGAGGFLLSLITYCVVRRLIASTPQTPSRLYWAARLCFLCGALKIGLGILQITLFKDTVGIYWGWLLLLFGVLWLVRGSKLRRRALTVSVGYQAFNHDAADNANANNASNVPVQVVVDASEASLHAASRSKLSQPLIRNAVPPSPFASSQGNELYPLPSIPMMSVEPAETMASRSGSTPGHIAHLDLDTQEEEDEEVEEDEEKIVNTLDEEQHAEDSIYVDEENERETPSGGPDMPERKTSEGNTTMC